MWSTQNMIVFLWCSTSPWIIFFFPLLNTNLVGYTFPWFYGFRTLISVVHILSPVLNSWTKSIFQNLVTRSSNKYLIYWKLFDVSCWNAITKNWLVVMLKNVNRLRLTVVVAWSCSTTIIKKIIVEKFRSWSRKVIIRIWLVAVCEKTVFNSRRETINKDMIKGWLATVVKKTIIESLSTMVIWKTVIESLLVMAVQKQSSKVSRK